MYGSMLTKWHYSPEYEARRLIETAYQTLNGFFHANNFLVLSKLPKNVKSSPYIVILPDLEYPWEKIKSITYHSFPIGISDKALLAFALNNISNMSPLMSKIETAWKLQESEAMQKINTTLGVSDKYIKNINIYKTHIGPRVSFNYLREAGDINIYLRYDAVIGDIVYAIVSSLTRFSVFHKYQGDWIDSQFLADWLLNETPINTKFKFMSVFKNTKNKQSSVYKLQSIKFYKKLGLPLGITFECIDNKIYANSVELRNLTSRETSLLSAMISRDVPLSYDDIAKIVFVQTEDFSLQAISKIIERLRLKLAKNGISSSYIKTLRDYGFLLQS